MLRMHLTVQRNHVADRSRSSRLRGRYRTFIRGRVGTGLV
jgi:hypothetical protein